MEQGCRLAKAGPVVEYDYTVITTNCYYCCCCCYHSQFVCFYCQSPVVVVVAQRPMFLSGANVYLCCMMIDCHSAGRNRRSNRFLARDSITLSALYAIARPSVGLSVTRVDQSKRVEVQFSPYSSAIPLDCAG